MSTTQTFGDRLRAQGIEPLSGDARDDYSNVFRARYTHDPASTRWMSRERMEDRTAGQEMYRAGYTNPVWQRAYGPITATITVAVVIVIVWAILQWRW